MKSKQERDKNLILNRIKTEYEKYSKYPDMDWMEIAARKIASNLNQPLINNEMTNSAIKSDDFDLQKSWFECTLGGNGDYYLTIFSEDENGLIVSNSVRVSTSGGYTKNKKITLSICNLYKAINNIE